MSVSLDDNHWIQLTGFTKFDLFGGSLIKIDNKEYARFGNDGFLYKYNINQNKWNKWSIATNNNPLYRGTSAYDEKQRILYIYSAYNQTLTKFNINSSSTKMWSNLTDIGHNAHGIILNDQFNIIGGTKSNNHLIWDNKQNKFKNIHHFDDFQSLYFSGFIHLKSKQSLLFLGGCSGFGAVSKSLYSYNIKQQRWSKLSYTLPKQLYYFGCIASRDQRYLVILGGIDSIFQKQHDICLLDVKSMIFTQINLSCPEKECFQAINMNDKDREEILNYGFIRKLFKEDGFKNMLFPHFYLIKMIASYYSDEWIYLLSANGNHWKIKLDDIITSD